MTRLLAVIVVATLLPPALLAQSPPDSTNATFDVASIRQNTSGDVGGSYDMRPGNQLVIRNYTLGDIILNTYGIRTDQLRGGPGWIATDRFDIVAKLPNGVARNAEMMRTLLAELAVARLPCDSL